MSNTRVITVLILAAAIMMPVYGQTTDPKATDMNGNSAPAWVMTQDKDGETHVITKGDKKASPERLLAGIVTDADGKPLVGAVVQLKNTRTLQIRSFITKEKGDYSFAGLNKDIDYEVKAQFNGKTSPSRTLSSFDTKPAPVLNLQIK